MTSIAAHKSHHPMQFKMPIAVFVIGTLSYLAIRIAFKRKLSTGKKAVRRSTPTDMLLVALVAFGQIGMPLLAIATPLLAFANYRPPNSALWFGIASFSFGLWLFWRSHADLGSNWSVSLELEREHRLVTSGVYSRIRHPMYASFFAMALAQAALIPNLMAGLAALVAVTILYVVRKPNEEAMMLEHFGSDYVAYMRRSGGVIPPMRAVR
jgi:protein-S-isoprenylcysteine O-methyltransferase Ste14